MARPKKMEDEDMLALVQKFYIEKCRSNPAKLKIPAIGNYIRSLGYDIDDFLIRKNRIVREYINSTKNTQVQTAVTRVAAHRDIDVDAFLAQNSSPQALRKALIDRDNYYGIIADSAVLIFKENETLKKKVAELTEKAGNFEKIACTKEAETADLSAENRNLKTMNRAFKNIINKYVYPEIANELMKKEGILVNTGEYLDPARTEENVIKADDDIKGITNNVVKGLFDKIGK